MKQDSEMEFDILLDSLNSGQGKKIERAADVLQALGRWLLREDHVIEGNNAIELAEDIESNYEEASELLEEVQDLKDRFVDVPQKPVVFDKKVLSDSLAFWVLARDKSSGAADVLNNLAEVLDKEDDKQAASHARDLALWVSRVRQ